MKPSFRILLGQKLYWTMKEDGCFYAYTPILLEDFTTKTIKEIVDKHLNVKVLSINRKTKKIEIKRVIGWSKSDESCNFLKVKSKDGLTLLPTNNHPFCNVLNPRMKFRYAINLKRGNTVYLVKKMPNASQREVIFGTLLGDSCISQTSGVIISHSEKQLNYILKLNNLFKEFNSNIRKQVSGFGSEIYNLRISFRKKGYKKDFMEDILNKCKFANKKRISFEWLKEISPLSLAIWYMDDGTLFINNKNDYCAGFSCQGYSDREIEMLRALLYFKFGIEVKVWRKYIKIYKKNASILFKLISPFIVPSLRYKLPPEMRKNGLMIHWWKNVRPVFKLITSKISSMEDTSITGYRYNIEVEDNNTFFAGYTLVHNSCTAIWKKEDKIIISSKHIEEASSDIQSLVKRTEDYPKVLELIEENPSFIFYVEACRKGRSITGIKVYDRDTLYLFDILDRESGKFLTYINVHQHAYHHNIPVVKLYAETRHRTLKDLLKFKNHVLGYCDGVKIEGMVIKAYKIPDRFKNWRQFDKGMITAKVKLDIPEPILRKISKGDVILPPIPEVEVMGSISKVEADYGLTGNPKDDMPHIAKYVNEDCKVHLYSKPKGKLYSYYLKYLERLK